MTIKGLNHRMLLRIGTAFGGKLAGAGAGLLATLLMAHLMPVEDFGLVAYLTSLTSLMGIVALAGHEAIVIRESAAYRARGEMGLLAGLWRWSGLATLVFSLLLAAAGFGVTLLLGVPHGQMLLYGLGWLWLPLIVSSRIGGAMLQGSGRVLLGDFLGQTATQILFCIVLMGCAALGVAVTAGHAIEIRFWVLAATVVVLFMLVLRLFAGELARAEPELRPGQWMREAFPFALLSGVLFLMTESDLFVIKLFLGDGAAGLYRPPQRIVWVISFGLLAVNTLVQPRIAALHARSDREGLQDLVTRSTRAGILLTLPLTVLVIGFAEPLLGLFGEAYREGATALRILAAGQLMNVASGPVAMLLNMSGLQSCTFRQTVTAALLNVLLAVLLVPVLGFTGGALSTALALTAWNLLLLRQVRQRLGLRPTIFAGLGLGRAAVRSAPPRPAQA